MAKQQRERTSFRRAAGSDARPAFAAPSQLRPPFIALSSPSTASSSSPSCLHACSPLECEMDTKGLEDDLKQRMVEHGEWERYVPSPP